MSKINPELISMFHVKVYKSIITTSPEYLEKPVKPGNFRVGYSQNSAFNFEKKNIRVRLEIILDGIDERENLIGIQGDFGLDFHFHVENLDEFIEELDGNKKVSGNLGPTLISIAYSTARGIVIERTQGTFLNGTILPVIDPNVFLKEAKESSKP